VKRTTSGVASVTVNVAWPLDPVVAELGVTVALLPALAVNDTVAPAIAVPVESFTVTVTVDPVPPATTAVGEAVTFERVALGTGGEEAPATPGATKTMADKSVERRRAQAANAPAARYVAVRGTLSFTRFLR
jgi:hypothetical protein